MIDQKIDQGAIYQQALDVLQAIIKKALADQTAALNKAGIRAALIDVLNLMGPQYVYGGPCCSIGGTLRALAISPPAPVMQSAPILGLTILCNTTPTAAVIEPRVNGVAIGSFAVDAGNYALSFLASELSIARIQAGDTFTFRVVSTVLATPGADMTVSLIARLDVLRGAEA